MIKSDVKIVLEDFTIHSAEDNNWNGHKDGEKDRQSLSIWNYAESHFFYKTKNDFFSMIIFRDTHTVHDRDSGANLKQRQKYSEKS